MLELVNTAIEQMKYKDYNKAEETLNQIKEMLLRDEIAENYMKELEANLK